jgi:outer membrane protein assembly factor BamB
MSQPAVADGTVFMAYPGQGGHRLAALALADGKTLWEAPIGGDIISAPVIDKDGVYLATHDGTVYRFERATGKLSWKEAMHAVSAPSIDARGEVRVARGESRGAERYEALQRLNAGSGAVVGGQVARKKAEYLEAEVQAKSDYGSANQKDDSSVGFGSGAPAAAKAPAAAANLGQSSVKGLWEFQGSRPTVSGGKSFATRGDTLQALDAKGNVLWEGKLEGDLRATGGHLASPPAWAGGKLVVGTTAGTIDAWDAESGKRVFSVEVGAPIRFQPALAGGRVFVGTERGTLVSVATGDASLDRWTMWGGGPRHNGVE